VVAIRRASIIYCPITIISRRADRSAVIASKLEPEARASRGRMLVRELT
jgi:hypothetical protein